MKQKNEPPAVVCFDLGGVMLRICHTWREGCEAAGLPTRHDIDESQFAAERWTAMNRAYQSGRLGGDEFAVQFSELLDGLYAPDEIMRVHHDWIRGEYQGVGELVDALHDEGIVTAVLSNTCHEHWETMDQYPAVMRVKHRLASHLIATCKPDEAAYLAIESVTGFAGTAIVFFDDLAENVAAATALGWRAVQIDPRGDTVAQMWEALLHHGVEFDARRRMMAQRD